MKNLQLPASFFVILMSCLFCSCTKDQNQNYFSTTKEFISQGKWSVDYYYEGGDKTALFSSYEFHFTGNGNLTGTNGTNSFSGTWSVVRDVNYTDVLHITINSQDPQLIDLNDQWNVTEKNNLVISMKDEVSQLRFKRL